MADSWRSDSQYSVTELLRQRLSDDPDGPYLDVVGEHASARQVDERSNRLANALSELGVVKGDRVATLLENSMAAVVGWWAIVKTGAIAVPINTAYKGEYLKHQLDDSGASVLLLQGDLARRGIGVVEEVNGIAHVVLVGEPEVWEVPGAENHDLAALLGADSAPVEVALKPSDLATFIYTGGTTGPSKGCMLSHNYHDSLSRQIGRVWQRTSADVVWTPLPLFHYNSIVTAVIGSLIYGGRAAIAYRFSVSNFWPEMNRVGATITSTLGTMATMLAHAPEHPEEAGIGTPQANQTLRLFGAVPMPPEIDEIFRTRFGVKTFSAAYGTTEASLVSMSLAEENPQGAAGRVNSEEFDVRIFDDDDNEVPTGTPGEIVVRPRKPHVMFEGYWGRPEATVETSRNWWYHTGDIGSIDPQRFLTFVDRKADYLRRRGENISSFEMEKVFYRHPAIAEVAVHAVPSEFTEDDVKVTAVLKAESDLTEEDLCRWAVDELPYFAMPRYVEFRDELPKNPVGRVLKYVLRDEGVTAGTWDIEASDVSFERR